MKRRAFLRAAKQAVVLAALPVSVRRAFADATAPDLEILEDAWTRAAGLGKPVLVIVPSSEMSVGGLLGELLNHGPDELFEDLALCDIVCVSPAAIRTRASALPRQTPILVLLETDGSGTVRSIEPDLATPNLRGRRSGTGDTRSWEDRERSEADPIDERIRRLAEQIHLSLGPDLERRSKAAAAHFDKSEIARLREAAASGSIAPNDAYRVAAVLEFEAFSLPPHAADRVRETLRLGSRARFVKGRLPGSKWAVATGCGVGVEYLPGERRDPDDDAGSYSCGMGSVSPKSARFLKFYTQAK